MTLGEKIQQCRKRLSMSQEDLGQKMLVSRQTVSLWESDKTMPTIDNLVRLREIFGISLDELLTGELPEEKEETEMLPAPEPNFKYSFEFSKEESSVMSGKLRAKRLKNGFLFILLISVAALVSADNAGWFGFFLTTITMWLIRSGNTINTFAAVFKSEGVLYEIEEYPEFLILNVRFDGDMRRTFKLYYSEIKKAYVRYGYPCLEISGVLLCFKDEVIPQTSHIRECFAKEAEKKKARRKENALAAVSIILILLSLAAPVAGLFISVELLEEWETNWIMFPFALIPIALFVLGLLLKKCGKAKNKYAANIAFGIFCTVITLVSAFLGLMMSYTVPFDSQTEKAESYLGIDLPEGIHVKTGGSEEGGEATNGQKIYYTSTVYFEDAAVEQFEAMLDTDDRWFEKLPDELEKLVSAFAYYSEGECSIVIYNITTNQINTVPQESGSYRIITFSYIKENKTMHITEYDIEYEK